MSNGVKRGDRTALRSDRLLAGAVPIGLVGAAALLPVPWRLTAALAGRRVATSSDLDVVLDAVALGAASIVVWLLIGWMVVIGVLTLIARTPGTCGRLARSTLARITPGFVRRSIAIGMSVGALTGVAIGTAPAGAGPPVPTTMTIAGPAHSAFPSPARQLSGPIDRAAIAVATSADRVGNQAPDSAPDRLGMLGEAARHPGEPTAEESGTAAREVLSRTPARPAAPRALTAPQTLQIDVDWPVRRPSTVAAAPVDLDWPSAPAVVVVHRGDSLWSIAARQLGPAATDEQIDAAWRAWYAVNRAVIGDDPDRILPGQQLHAPPAGTP